MLSEVLKDNEKFRFDPEYFKKEYLEEIDKLKKFGYSNIKDMAFVTDGIHESIDFDKNSNINLISAKSPKENIFDLSNNDYISSQQHIKNPRTELQKDDVIISTVGTIGNCAVVDKTILPANSDRHVGIVRLTNGFKPYVLSTFLLSKYGRFQTFRESTGNVQLNLFIYKIKTLKIPNFSDTFQIQVEQLVKLAHKKLANSKILYEKAENLLLKELDLLDFEPTKENISIKSFSESFGISGRIDSEYYLPKYDEIDKKFEKYEKIKLNKLVTYSISSGATPKAGGDAYTDKENGIPFIRAVNIIDSKVEFDNALYVKEHIHNKKLKKTKLKENDVLFSIAGTVGRCGISYYKKEANINQAVAILRFDDKIIKRLYLILFFNSEIGKLYISKYSRQGLQTNLNLNEIGNLEIPIIDYALQTQIENKIKESFRLKEESKELLELAKRGVEVAIEEGEDVAMEFIGDIKNG